MQYFFGGTVCVQDDDDGSCFIVIGTAHRHVVAMNWFLDDTIQWKYNMIDAKMRTTAWARGTRATIARQPVCYLLLLNCVRREWCFRNARPDQVEWVEKSENRTGCLYTNTCVPDAENRVAMVLVGEGKHNERETILQKNRPNRGDSNSRCFSPGERRQNEFNGIRFQINLTSKR